MRDDDDDDQDDDDVESLDFEHQRKNRKLYAEHRVRNSELHMRELILYIVYT